MNPLRTVASLAVALFLALVAGAIGAPAQPDPGSLVDRMAKVNGKLQSYTATTHVDIAMHSFPFLSPALDGTYYFKQPDKQAIVFNTVPALAKEFQKVYPRLDPPGSWVSLYTISTFSSDATTTTLRLVPKKHGRVAHLDVRVDNTTATPIHYTWSYEDGGSVDFDQQYAQINGNFLVKSESGKIDLPQYKADVTSTFSNFKLNVPIEDKVFEG